MSSLCAVVLNDYLYCIGGQTIPLKNEMSTNHVYRMDLKSKDRHWEKVTPTGKKRYVMGATVLHGMLLISLLLHTASNETFFFLTAKIRNISASQSQSLVVKLRKKVHQNIINF